MLNPANRDLTVWRGGTYATRLKFYSSTSPVQKFDLTEYEVFLVVDDMFTMKEGEGITVSEENEVLVELTATQTEASASASRAHYYMKFVKGVEVVFPVRGNMTFENP